MVDYISYYKHIVNPMDAKKIIFNIQVLLKRGEKKQAAALLWPWFVQNEQSDRIWDALDNNSYLAVMGHGSASKTFTCSGWFLLDWWTDPHNTALIITSDTISSMNRRIWSDIKTFWSKSSVRMPGELIDSKRIIQTNSLDQKNAIAGIAAESDDAQSKIQGIHTKRVRVIIDEADNKLSRSIWGAIPNLQTSGDVKVVALANPVDRTSDFGRQCEPRDGWLSVNPEVDQEWMSKTGWKVIRLDGLRSPNILAKKDIYPFLLTNKGVESIREKKTENSLEWWAYVRAWYPPEGIANIIFSPDVIGNCNRKILWHGQTQMIASCDPAFEGGDDCIFCYGRMGRIADAPHKTAIQIEGFEKIARKDLKEPITIDYGNQIIKRLDALGVKHGHFAIDRTGNGRGLSDYITHAWKGEILPIEFGGSPTNLRITTEDSASPKDRFDRFVSELWYAAREWCKLGLVSIQHHPRELTFELESRTYSLKNNKISVESKTDMKDRGLNSPDRGDAFTMLIHLVRFITSSQTPGIFSSKQERHDPLRIFRKNQTRFNANYGVKERD